MADTTSAELTLGVSFSGNAGWCPLSILGLLSSSSPSTVVRSVVAVVVDTLKGMFGRGARTHVLKEVLEAIHPTRTDSDASSSVSCEVEGVGVQTSVLHRLPRVVFQGLISSMLGGKFLPQTAATPMSPTTKIARTGNNNFTTVTPTNVRGLTSSICCSALYKKTLELFSRQIFQLRHVSPYHGVSMIVGHRG